MNEKEQPIRHQRDPNLSPIPRHYKRTRAPANDSWIPESETGSTNVFPWLLRETVESEHQTSATNPEFTTAVDEAKTVSVYGEWQGAESLSAEGRKIVNDIIFVFDNLNKELVETGGKVPESPLFAGAPLDQYLQMIDDTIKDKREHRYIMEQFGRAFDQSAQIRRKAVAEGPVAAKEKPVTNPYINPSQQFNKAALSATTAINLAHNTPFDQVKPSQEEPKLPVVASTPSPSQQLIDRIESRNFSRPKPERRVPTDIIKDALVAEGLIDLSDNPKSIVLVTMRRIIGAVRDVSSQAELYEMVTRMIHDPGIDDNDIEKLRLFTDRLLNKK